MRKWIIVILIFSACLFTLTQSRAENVIGQRGQQHRRDWLIDRAKKFKDAQARQDYDAARSFLAPDARVWFEEKKGEGSVYKIPGAWNHWDTYFQGRTTYVDWQENGNEVSVVGHEINDYYRLLDWRPWPYKQTWWFNDQGQITGVLVQEMPGQGETGSRLNEFKEWAKQNRPEELTYLMPKGVIDPSADRPERWRAILIDWRKAAGLPAVKLDQ